MKTFKNLSEFVASWPQGVTVLQNDNAERHKSFSELTMEDKWQYAENNWFLVNQLEVSHKGNNWYMYRRVVEIKRRGLSFYPKSKLETLISIVNGKLSINRLTWRHIYILHPRYEWVSQITSSKFGGSITNKTLLKEVLVSNIANPESFYKWILKHTYRTEAIPWKLFREYANNYMRMSVYDLVDATTNPKLAIEAWLEASKEDNWQLQHLLEDSIITALKLGEKINPQWSIKRLQAEHQRQIEAIQLKRIDAMESTPASHVLDAYDFPLGVKWLNTEGAVFKEATRMHHCLHSNYWGRIKRGDYIAFAIDHNDEHFTLGCRFNGDFCMYDQAHTIYNGSVSDENRMFINDLIRDIDQFLAKQRELVDFDWNRFIRDYELPY